MTEARKVETTERGSPVRNLGVLENFPKLFGYAHPYPDRLENDPAAIILRECVEELGFREFNSLDYIRDMIRLAGAELSSDEEIENFINWLKEQGKKHIGLLGYQEATIRVRRELKGEWPKVLAEFREKERRLYNLWGEKMLEEGLKDHPFLELYLERLEKRKKKSGK